MPEGQVEEHAGVAVKSGVVPLGRTEAVVGDTLTEVSPEELEEVMSITAVPALVVPFKVAFTERRTTPALLPAVKVVEAEVGEFTVPSVLFMLQEYVIVPGQVVVQLGVAVNVLVVAPVLTSVPLGLTETDVMTFPPEGEITLTAPFPVFSSSAT